MRKIARPEPGEYAPYTTAYFDLVPGDDVLTHMVACLEHTVAFIESLSPDHVDVAHRHGEWTIKEIIQHVIDDERIYTYRALRFARNDQIGRASCRERV